MTNVTAVSLAAISEATRTGPEEAAMAAAPPANANPARATTAKTAPQARYRVERKSTWRFTATDYAGDSASRAADLTPKAPGCDHCHADVDARARTPLWR